MIRVLAPFAALLFLLTADSVAAVAEDAGVAGPALAAGAGPPALPDVTIPYYVAEAGEARGPLSLDVVLAEVKDGTVLPWTLVWKPGLSGWIRAGALAELGDALAEATPRPPPPPPQPPPPPPDLPAEEIYFIAAGEAVRGPLSEDEIGAAIAEGSITRATLVWQPGMAGWVSAWEVPALRGHFAAKPPEVPLTDAMRQLMIGTWEFVAEYGDGMVANTTLAYRPDMTFSGFVSVTMSGTGLTTHAVSGGWSVTGATSERFALTLSPTEGKPGTVQLRVVDRDNLVNETDGGTARRIVD
jgi:hypothetical protein